MKEYEFPANRILEAEHARFRRFFSCSIGSVFDLAAEQNVYLYCIVIQQASGMSAEGPAKYWGAESGGPLIDALLTVDGVSGPDAIDVGYVYVYYDASIFMGFGLSTDMEIRPEQQLCMGNSIWANAPDGNVYVTTIQARWIP